MAGAFFIQLPLSSLSHQKQKANVNHILSHCFPKEKGEIKNVTNSRLKVTKNVT
jgi:hypothetical protein